MNKFTRFKLDRNQFFYIKKKLKFHFPSKVKRDSIKNVEHPII